MDDTLEELLKEVRLSRAMLAMVCTHLGIRSKTETGATRVTGNGGPQPITIATDAEMDSGRGDPVVKFDPKHWKGQSYVGRKFSQTEPDYLDMLAGFKQWQANNPREGDDSRKTGWALADAALARGWAKRLRERPAPTVSDDNLSF